MVEIKVIVNYIKESRKRGFRDDFIKKSIFEKGYSKTTIKAAFVLREKIDRKQREKMKGLELSELPQLPYLPRFKKCD